MNDNQNLQEQINQLNAKMDLVLEYVNQQRLKAEAVEDLIADAAIIGKDIYNTTVTSLEEQQVDLQPDELRNLGVAMLRNVQNFNVMLNTFESSVDLMKDLGPIANELIIDFTKKMAEFEQKGYFEFLQESMQIVDNVVTGFSREDVRSLADNVVTILQTVKHLTQPEMLKALDNALVIYSSMDTKNVPEYSIFKVMRELNKPEMKRGMGFIMTFVKNLANQPK
jgi:uncharacterized protein YjgD (DUF1641 family)